MDTATLESDVMLAGGGDEAAFRRLVERSANTVSANIGARSPTTHSWPRRWMRVRRRLTAF